MEFVGPINSAFIHCSQKTGQQMRLKGKKKKRENADTARFKCYTNIHLIYSHAN